MSTKSDLVISLLIVAEKYPQCNWTVFELLGFNMFTRTDPFKITDSLIGSVVGNSVSSLWQGSRSALLHEQILSFFDDG